VGRDDTSSTGQHCANQFERRCSGETSQKARRARLIAFVRKDGVQVVFARQEDLCMDKVRLKTPMLLGDGQLIPLWHYHGRRADSSSSTEMKVH
jgi:hypothetical protein